MQLTSIIQRLVNAGATTTSSYVRGSCLEAALALNVVELKTGSEATEPTEPVEFEGDLGDEFEAINTELLAIEVTDATAKVYLNAALVKTNALKQLEANT